MRSPQKPELLAAPGNAGIARDRVECLDLAVDDIDGIVATAKDRGVDLVVVGPEAPLVAGLVDALADARIRAFGPSGAAARIEGSKAYAKDLMRDVVGMPIVKQGDEITPHLRMAGAEAFDPKDLQRFRRIVESLPLAVYLDQADAQAASFYVSPQIEDDVRLSVRALVRRTFFESVIHPDDRERVLGRAHGSFRRRLDRWSFRYRVVAADGRVVWVRDDAIVIRDDERRAGLRAGIPDRHHGRGRAGTGARFRARGAAGSRVPVPAARREPARGGVPRPPSRGDVGVHQPGGRAHVRVPRRALVGGVVLLLRRPPGRRRAHS